MKNRLVIAGVLVVIVVLLAWNFLFFAPAGKDKDKAQLREQTAQQTGATLDSQLHALEKVSAQAPEQKAQLDKLNAAVPPTPDLEGFIRSAVDLEQQAGVDWVDIEPTEPAAGPGTASQIKMSIVISGGFFQVLDYLNRLEALGRLVVTDGINVTTGASATGGGSTSGTTPTTSAATSGAPDLTVTLSSRMFTQAPPAAAVGSGPGATNTTPTSTTPTSSSGSTPATTGAAN